MKDKSVLPLPLYRASQVRELDRIAIEEMGIPGICLMERAGSTAFQVMQTCFPKAKRIIVLCGTGNNGGDGYVVARLAYLAGYDVTVLQLGNTNQLKGESRLAFEGMLSVGLSPQVFSEKKLSIVDLIVDALIGTGLDRDVAGKFRDVIDAVSRRTCPVLSLDIPSGLQADTGKVMGTAIKADITVSFIGLKQGLFTGDGPEYCGKIYFDDLQVPEATFKQVRHTVSRLPDILCREAFKRRPRNAHKGAFGHALIIGGERGMTGAARLAAEAAGRVGAGKVSIATRTAHADMLNLTRPEIMCHGVETAKELKTLLEQADVVAIGTGLGQGQWAKEMLEAVRHTDKPIVVDADALNLLAHSPFRFSNSVITPHSGEAARLLHLSTDEVESDRFAAVQALQLRFGNICVLKGAGTLIADTQGQINICTAGNPGMATGGMGDVLTGVIVGLLAQGFSTLQAAHLGVCLHGKAGDKAALEGERGLLPSDLLPWLRYFVNPELQQTD
ncbi:bifunctional ADP-dependent NAD(P)H-hydrate dehydratase/NAD(P)H-hydrate epimerase [Beggiatoa leptomitoformis]|uniref:Bifunctional NAD(P)H-hydrate repair enzyme n=1 Tax=Beggiatoa leptomitoformis TaxID=288004 RepID=A0A2N9YDN5_9GAMM|nr:bifunctional ADP-dependent NAD(P)H-hydrate dehydratase/NAD(P)H-hydrate epimerase [Beggiatoa leptomitoformis]ALG69030.1 bifunctional ADP-dependent NAD(P)H-hydrate dehydratase/NAD(P)H-hydrate epimerase [Beggiatoa leptomitoformis]AUI68566.1 bifunctional ADP-dependent NAD(P)H-hydrate dehydratase/NAD(P)H-hydrate epimerase [Beggiatoa leptomitoformis]